VPSYYSYSEFFQNQQVGYGATIATALTIVIMVLTVVFIGFQNRMERRESESS
jgi:raffinose/stachyose/melibiose transport system permease protein